MSRRIRWGVLGCGRIARKSMLPAIADAHGAELSGVASERPGVAAAVVGELQRGRAFNSYDDLLADDRIDAVYVPATGDRHFALVQSALSAGKHVLCEKPLTRTVREAEELVTLADKAGLLLQEAFMWRHHPRTTETLRLLRSGAIGVLKLVRVDFSFTLAQEDWRLQPDRGGGAVWDLGCYGVNAARLFAGGEPVEVTSVARFATTGADLAMQIALRFSDDVLASIDCGFDVPWRCRLELVGTAGTIEWPTAFQHWNPVIWLRETPIRWDGEPQVIHCPEVNQYRAQVEAFGESVAAGRLLSPAEDGLANMRVLEAAMQTAKRSAPI
ncbi:MAG: Gfo/Idh/MocA family oxidoreductase [Planctomycetaceae bacterium]